MVQKYFFILIMLVSTMVISCRQTEELSTTEDLSVSLQDKVTSKEKDGDDENEIKRDSAFIDEGINDPPKSGTHWKTKK